MSAPRVRADYDQLAQIAQAFGLAGFQTDATMSSLKSAKGTLQSGDWIGRGATAFYGEMDSQVLPALQRLVSALQQAQQVTAQINAIMQQVENEVAALFRVTDSSGSKPETPPAGYTEAGNVNSTDAARIDDFKSVMAKTEHGRELLKWLKDFGVDIQFGDPSNANTIAYCTLDGKHIVINKNYAKLTDYELAATLLHESQHSKDSHPFDIPIVGPIFNEWYNAQYHLMYPAYPFPEEYRASCAEAEFWKEVQTGQPFSKIENDKINLIFNADGSYRDTDAVYRDLHNGYGYKGIINP